MIASTRDRWRVRTGWPLAAAMLVMLASLTELMGCRAAAGPRDTFHRIEPAPAAAAAAEPALDGVLEVAPLRAEAVLTALPLLYRESDAGGPLVRYGYQLWTDPPAAMLQRAIAAYLQSTGVAERVVVSEQRARPDYVLRGRIVRLEHHPAELAVEIGLQLDLAGDGGARPLYSLTAVERVPTANATARAAVDAYETGLARILDELRAGITAERGE